MGSVAGGARANQGGVSHLVNFVVKVCDPVEQGKGMGAYVSYRVQTQTTHPSYKRNESEVIRRFRDFVWLAERLTSTCAGVIIPPLPEKDVVQKFQMNADFIQRRCRAINVFINRVVAHPVLRESKDVQLFLEASEADWQYELARVGLEKGGLQTAVSNAKGLFQGLTSKMGELMSGGKLAEGGEGEDASGVSRAYIMELDACLAEVHRQAHLVTQRHAKMCQSLEDFHLAMMSLSEVEEEGSQMHNMFRDMSEVVEEQAADYRKHVDKLQEVFAGPLKEYHRYMSSVKFAIQELTNSSTAVIQRKAEFEGKKARLAKLRVTPGIQEIKVSYAEQDMNISNRKWEEAKEREVTVRDRLAPELARFQGIRATDLEEIFRQYAAAEVEASKAQAARWKSAAPKFATTA
mgnify:FL=1